MALLERFLLAFFLSFVLGSHSLLFIILLLFLGCGLRAPVSLSWEETGRMRRRKKKKGGMSCPSRRRRKGGMACPSARRGERGTRGDRR